MCGGADERPIPKVGWRKILEILGNSKARNCVFVEVTRGCSEYQCPFSCMAQQEKYRIAIPPRQLGVVQYLFPHGDLPIVLWGLGETSGYPYNEITRASGIPPGLEISLIPSLAEDEKLSDEFLGAVEKVVLNIYTPDEVLKANCLASKLRERGHKDITIFAKIPVLEGGDYFAMADRVRGPEVLFHSVSVGSPRHIPKDVFVSHYRERYGTTPNTAIYPDPAIVGVKPVIEKIIGNAGDRRIEVIFRRCFRSDVQKYVLVCGGKWDFGDDDAPVTRARAEEFLGFLRSPALCDTCDRQTWRAW